MFRIDNTDNIIDVNVDNLRWEYDQANFICPSVTKSGNPNEEPEKYIIYNVSKEEYDSCMVKLPSVIHSDQMTRIYPAGTENPLLINSVKVDFS